MQNEWRFGCSPVMIPEVAKPDSLVKKKKNLIVAYKFLGEHF